MLQISDLSVEKSDRTILKGISFTLNPGDRMILSGRSGSGKSTLIRSLLCFEPITAGEIRWRGEVIDSRNVRSYRRYFVYIAQKPPTFDGSVEAYLRLPATFRNNCCEAPSEARIREALSRFGLGGFLLDQPYASLSGGEQQRITLIQGLLLDRPVLLLDEVTSSLDPANVDRVVDAILGDESRIVIAVSHQERWRRSGVQTKEIRDGGLVPKEDP